MVQGLVKNSPIMQVWRHLTLCLLAKGRMVPDYYYAQLLTYSPQFVSSAANLMLGIDIEK